MSKRCKNKLGLIIGSIGLGLVIAVLLPFWGWILAGGAALIYLGWYLMENK
ncbi:hypothetical protein [Desnuesiella massiliensis]|uniref:hypothetical protein n=1 Tax=Desnuesiella massiliensis TaxID=1650662 RepID=UPI0018A841C0|nr:hypothetical protein [Desnuesiella massiliensis]